MNSLLERLYVRSPAYVQDLIVSAYGCILHRQRYGGNFQRHLTEVQETQWWSAERLEALQNARLTALIHHAYANTRYYRRLFDRLGLMPEDIACKDDLRKLPVLTKDDLREHFHDIVASNIPRRRIFVDHTSGTTGTPRMLYIDLNCLQYNYALLAREREWAGLPHNARRASLHGRVIVPANQQSPPFWRYNWAENQLLLSSYHLSANNIPAYVEQLLRFKPELIAGYPSSIYALAREMKEQGLAGVHPKAVLTSAETLLSYQRECIKEQFTCRVLDCYGSSELAFWVGQCSEGSYHVCPEFGIVEILRNREPVGYGEVGHIVCTGLLNYAMPLIRYEVGDIAVFSSRRCTCGRESSLLESIEGRIEDVVITPDGRKVGRLDSVFKNVTNVVEAQIVQEDEAHLIVNVVRSAGYTGRDSQAIRSALQERLGSKMDFRLDFVPSIPRTKAGKFRFVISHLEEHS